jgi:superfamily II DNA or RNA helicase/diadenosine tetraphosphate (Ap4A) HIT family hydrolase
MADPSDGGNGRRSPFLDVPAGDHIAGNRLAFAIWDGFPVSPGHALVVPRRLISSWWETTAAERADLFALVEEVKQFMDREHDPDGYNVGFNGGEAAGQTVPHLHIHVIPRYSGDVPDPRGGIRNVIPGKGNYLVETQTDGGGAHSAFELFDGHHRPLEDELLRHLRDARHDRVDLVVSFIKRSGLDLIDDALQDALERGAQVRILTTDYMEVTEHAALGRLLDLAAADHPPAQSSNLRVRVFRDAATSFHPKAYLFWSSRRSAATVLVGSSNLSRSGLAAGIEWNVAFASAGEALARFEGLWADPRAIELTAEWLRSYRPDQKVRTVPPVVEIVEPPVQPVEPRPIQREALTALEETRGAGHRAGLVVMATGLGKTWLAAFDSARPQFRRVLFVAHREEILRQSRDVFRRVQPDGDLGLYFGEEKDPDARIVFASVQTLARRLARFRPDEFEYVVIDEFHHAAASSYRKVIDHFVPKFLLGLTATPQRMDGADLLALCDDNLVYECGLFQGIERDELVPFKYRGVPDTVDFEPIPWRSGRFDVEALTTAVETQERAQSALEEWQGHRGTRSLGFCVSTSHADFMARYFNDQGIRCAAVHSGLTTAPRHETIELLRAGDLDIVFAVDLFNEGLDVPEVDTVLMLRPTESPVVFLQQLGRGLRTCEDKTHLAVVDFIGNHRSFLLKPRTLLSLGTATVPSTAAVLAAMESGEFPLPAGCSVSYELEAIEMLKKLAKVSGRSGLEEYCRSYYEEEGERPSASQAFYAGYNPRAAQTRFGGWFAFVNELGIASQTEASVIAAVGDALQGLERERITKSYKLIVLRALLHDGALRTGETVARVAATSRTIALGDPRLLRDFGDSEVGDLGVASEEAWVSYWRRWPIAHLTEGDDGRWFRLENDRIVPRFNVPDELADTFDAMAAELVEYRLASYLSGKERPSGPETWTLRVSHTDGRPLIFLNRDVNRDLPEGEATFVADGRDYVGRFMRVAMNVAEIPGQSGNALHALLRGWFGPSAGHPGTRHEVVLERDSGHLALRPLESTGAIGGQVIPLFADYAVACGALGQPGWESHSARTIELETSERLDSAREFVCFARGDSMAGSDDPIEHGDPLLFEWLETGSRADYTGQRMLIEYTAREGTTALLKRLARREGQYVLESDNSAYPEIVGQRDLRLVARLVRRLDQRDVNPLAARIDERFKRQDIPPLYGLEFNSGKWGMSGHVSLDRKAVLFVTLEKSESMSFGAHYVDHFEDPRTFVWSSQTSTTPDNRKGREVLDALETGTEIHLWVRRRKSDVAFVYLGLVVPVQHTGSKPMSVTFRLLTPVSQATWRQFHG